MTTELEFTAAGAMTEREARDFIGYVRTQQDELPRRTVDAYQRRAWLALGYETWAAMCDGEGLRLPREVTAELRQGGLSLRAISAVTGVGRMTAQRDASSVVPPTQGNGTTERITGLGGKSYPASRTEPPPAPSSRPEPVMLSLRTHKGDEVPYPRPQGKATFNETTGEGISWAAWSWNPVTGCLHGCDYCYARAIAHRYRDTYPAGFTPLFHEQRLDAPSNTTIPSHRRHDPAYQRVFVCSMADLYGRWVPDEWITRVHESMLAAPHWQYILLTKFPARYVGLDIPPNAWVGTSVDEQKRVRIAQDAMAKLDGGMVKWLSLEPLREPLEFDDLSMFDWVVIGAQTQTMQPEGPVDAFAPPWDWWMRIALQAHESGCRVHIKPNLFNGRPGSMPNEYPLPDPK